MKTLYQNLDFYFELEQTCVQVLTLALERKVQQVPRHSHGPGCYEVHYILFGFGNLSVLGNTYALCPETVYVIGPEIPHEESSLPDYPLVEYCLYFKLGKQTEKKPPALKHFLKESIWVGQDKQELLQILKQISEEMQNQHASYQEMVSALLKQFLIKLIRNCGCMTEIVEWKSSQSLTNQKSVIVEDCFLYEYKTLTLKELSRRLGLSTRQTERFLKEFYGKTFLQKRTEARMSAALVLLKESRDSVTEISEQLGYSSPEYFTAAFRKYYGTNPREFRKKWLLFQKNLV